MTNAKQNRELPEDTRTLAEKQRDALLAALDEIANKTQWSVSDVQLIARKAIAAVESGKALPNANDEVP